jgi:hypothetical protein
LREKLGEFLAEKVMYVAEAMNRHEYVPKMPNQSELDLVFDTTITDVQPYLYRVSRLRSVRIKTDGMPVLTMSTSLPAQDQ